MRAFHGLGIALSLHVTACDAPAGPSSPATAPLDPRAADVCEAACEPGVGCCTERFVHGAGTSVGWTRRGAAMFAVDEPDDTSAVLTRLKAWIAERPPRAGLSVVMADVTPLAGLTAGPVPPRRHGSLVLYRFAQGVR